MAVKLAKKSTFYQGLRCYRMTADTLVELHEAARKIGLNGHWYNAEWEFYLVPDYLKERVESP